MSYHIATHAYGFRVRYREPGDGHDRLWTIKFAAPVELRHALEYLDRALYGCIVWSRKVYSRPCLTYYV